MDVLYRYRIPQQRFIRKMANIMTLRIWPFIVETPIMIDICIHVECLNYQLRDYQLTQQTCYACVLLVTPITSTILAVIMFSS